MVLPTDPIPSEIAGQLDVLRRCTAPTIQGACAYSSIRGEKLCLEHSSSARGRRLRMRAAAILRGKLAARLREQGEVTWPEPPAAQPDDDAGGRQLRLPFPPTKEERERAQEREEHRPDYWALRWGEVAAGYLEMEDLCDMQAFNENVRREKVRAAVREIYEIRREQRAARERERRMRERLSRESELPRIYFHGDLSTPYGIAAAAAGATRLYAEGRITQRRCDTIMKGLRLVAVGRLLGSAKPLKFPELPRPERAIDNIIEADLRPYEARRVELRAVQNRFRSMMASRLLGEDATADAPEAGNDVPAEAREISSENKPDTSGSLTP
jgi:hypothetical protein